MLAEMKPGRARITSSVARSSRATSSPCLSGLTVKVLISVTDPACATISDMLPPLVQRLAVFFFLVKHGDVAIGAEPHLVAFDTGHELGFDIVVVALVPAFSRIVLDELDPPALDPVHRAHMHAVRADDLHMLAAAAEIGHEKSP